MNLYSPEMKTVLKTAFTAIVMGCSLHAGATDFALQNGGMTVYNATSVTSVSVDSSGNAAPAASLRIGAQGYGMPSFDIGFQASNVTPGDHIFWAAVLITGNNNDKYLRAFVDEVYLNVAEDGTITGRVNPTSNLTIKMDSGGDSVQEEINDIAATNVTFAAGNRMTFNASNLIELLGTAANHSARYQNIADDFTTGDDFTYKVLLGPRDYGVQGARVGLASNGTFAPFPLKAAQIVPGEAYVIEGQFSTTTAGGNTGVSQQVLSSVATTPATLLLSRNTGTTLDVNIPDGLFFYGASKDRGATTSTSFSAGDNIIIATSVMPQTEDLGKPADIFIVVRTTTAVSDIWTYRDSSGVFVPWSNAIPDLRPAATVSSLQNIEAFEVFSGTLIPAQHRIYVGYRVSGGTALLYTGQALNLNVSN